MDTYIYMCMCVCLSVCLYVCMHACMHVCMYLYLSIYRSIYLSILPLSPYLTLSYLYPILSTHLSICVLLCSSHGHWQHAFNDLCTNIFTVIYLIPISNIYIYVIQETEKKIGWRFLKSHRDREVSRFNRKRKAVSSSQYTLFTPYRWVWKEAGELCSAQHIQCLWPSAGLMHWPLKLRVEGIDISIERKACQKRKHVWPVQPVRDWK